MFLDYVIDDSLAVKDLEMDSDLQRKINKRNDRAIYYLTNWLTNKEPSIEQARKLIKKLGNSVESYPEWHPILTLPPYDDDRPAFCYSQIETYKGADHTFLFTRGFITCPYREERVQNLVDNVNEVEGLNAYMLDVPFHNDKCSPVVVECTDLQLQPDGTIDPRTALRGFIMLAAKNASYSSWPEKWEDINFEYLGSPCIHTSSFFVDHDTGSRMKSLVEHMNESGVFGTFEAKELWRSKLSPSSLAQVSTRSCLASSASSYSSSDEEYEDPY